MHYNGLKAVNYFREKALSHMFDWVLNTPLAGIGRNKKRQEQNLLLYSKVYLEPSRTSMMQLLLENS